GGGGFYQMPATPRSDLGYDVGDPVSTPQIPTPQDQPWTAAGWTPGYGMPTPGYPRTPNFGAVSTPNSAHSPAFGIPSTPAIPSTPMMPAPFTPYQPIGGAVASSSAPSVWLLEDIIVKITQGEFTGRRAVVKTFDPAGTAVQLELQDTHQRVILPISALVVAPIAAKDNIVVLYGTDRGALGWVHSMLLNDAAINLFDKGERVMKAHDLAPIARV
ncbi:MAG: hypothetical protein Q8P67_21100, partial [archaeon]|nr:hypothetical protein [archaeon]